MHLIGKIIRGVYSPGTGGKHGRSEKIFVGRICSVQTVKNGRMISAPTVQMGNAFDWKNYSWGVFARYRWKTRQIGKNFRGAYLFGSDGKKTGG